MKLEVGIWRDFQPLFRKRARVPPRLFSGETRDSGADRAHVTATKKETKIKIKYLEGLENLLYKQLVTQ